MIRIIAFFTQQESCVNKYIKIVKKLSYGNTNTDTIAMN